MDPAKSVKDQLNIIQINLNHSISAAEQLKINQYIRQADITCIEEPYYLNKIIGFSTSDRVVNFKYKPRTATIIYTSIHYIHTNNRKGLSNAKIINTKRRIYYCKCLCCTQRKRK